MNIKGSKKSPMGLSPWPKSNPLRVSDPRHGSGMSGPYAFPTRLNGPGSKPQSGTLAASVSIMRLPDNESKNIKGLLDSQQLRFVSI